MRGWVLAVAVCACSDSIEKATPIGGEQASPAEQQRFVRRLYLDLTGAPPDAAAMTTAIEGLAAGNTASRRGELAHTLLAGSGFAASFVAELENATFAGESLDARYGLICGIVRDGDPACAACAPAADPCAACSCPTLVALAAEKASLLAAPADLAGGLSTSAIERRFGATQVLRSSFGDGAAYTDALFGTFLARAAEPDERRNGAALFTGAIFGATRPAGVLFHRHGSNAADLVDILFASENYREAVVDRVFARFLGRPATPAELAHFTARLSTANPDARAVVEAVVSSREYFAQ